MKLAITVAWFLLLALKVFNVSADISLTLKNKQYISPPIQDLPINEEYFTAQQLEKFIENNYVFQKHNNYVDSREGGGNKQKSLNKQIAFGNNNFMPINNVPADFPLDDSNFDISYLGFATGTDDSEQQIIVQHETTNNIPVPFPSNFRHSFPEKSQSSAPLSFSSMQQYRSPKYDGPKFRGPDYLPPKSQVQPYFIQPDNQKTQQQGHSNVIEVNNNKASFKGPDYLPPQQQKYVLTQQQNSEYKGPVHLPPQQQGAERVQQNLASKNDFKGLDYLPPQQYFSSHTHENIEHTSPFKNSDYEQYYQPALKQFQQNFILKPQFKGSDYLPPQANFKAPDYLPPVQGSTNQQPDQQFRPSEQFKGSEYLPPGNSQEISRDQVAERQTLFGGSNKLQSQNENQHANRPFKGPDYLPPQQSQIKAPFKGPDYSQLGGSNKFQSQNENENSKNSFRGPDYLPPQQSQIKAPPFKGPEYSLHESSNKLQSQNENQHANKPFKGPDYLPPQQSQIKAPPLKGPDYTLHEGSNKLQSPNEIEHSKNTFKGPDYLPPQQFQINLPFKGPDYLPPVKSQLQPTQQKVYKLPDGYDFKKPPNAEQAIEELHKLPEESPVSQVHAASPNASPKENYGPGKEVDLGPHNGNLPLGYDFKKPENSEQAIQLLHSQETSKESSRPFKPNTQQFERSFSAQNIKNLLQMQKFRPNTDSAANSLTTAFQQKPFNAQQAINKKLSQQSTYKNNQLSVAQISQNYQTEAQKFAAFQQQGTNQATNFVAEPETTQLLQQPFKGSGYLPPPEDSQNFKQSEYSVPAFGSGTFKGLNYLPSSLEYLASQKGPGLTPTTAAFKGPDYLPPAPVSQNSNSADNSKSLGPQGETVPKAFQGPEYLSPSPGSQNNNGPYNTKPIVLQRESVSKVFNGPDYLPPASGSHNNNSPDNSKPIAHQIETVTKVLKGSDYLPPPFGLQNNKDSDSSKPIAPQRAAVSKLFKGPDYLPPANKPPSYESALNEQLKSPDYLPPTEHKTVVMYPLRNLMTNIKPNDRYGNKRPFSEYELPPANAVTVSNSNDIAPFYRQPTSKPQYYAPTASYTSNAFNNQISTQHQATSTLSQQARQTLQTFMPEDIRQPTVTNLFPASIPTSKSTTALQATKPAKAKVRTVQIVNPNAVKTLKILESLDDAGVKTIQILGSSNELPIGKHRVVKVVSGGNQQSVQTVKIFNDQQDFVSNENAAPTVGKGNSYLPPRTKRHPTSKPNV